LLEKAKDKGDCRWFSEWILKMITRRSQ
jgi:hypothetical protein